MRVAVMGAGGTGGWFGGLLARAGEDVTFIARGAHLAALRTSGLRVRTRADGGFALLVKATDNPREIGPVDLILFAVKDYDTDEAARQILPLVGPETMLLSTQNGIDNEERIGRIVGERAVIGAVALISARIDAPGTIANPSGQGQLIFGDLAGGTSPRTERLLALFAQAGIPAEVSADIRVD
ncbi:MAG: 2-dehydropantoate 2-reductase, partial [uncultured Thermomicrobiales bacterium]